jgi:hypothetical protein
MTKDTSPIGDNKETDAYVLYNKMCAPYTYGFSFPLSWALRELAEPTPPEFTIHFSPVKGSGGAIFTRQSLDDLLSQPRDTRVPEVFMEFVRSARKALAPDSKVGSGLIIDGQVEEYPWPERQSFVQAYLTEYAQHFAKSDPTVVVIRTIMDNATQIARAAEARVTQSLTDSLTQRYLASIRENPGRPS